MIKHFFIISVLVAAVVVAEDGYIEIGEENSVGAVRVLHHRLPSTYVAHSEQNVVRLEVQEIVTEMTCPANMILSNKQCIGKELCPPKYVCPSGTKLVDGECAIFSQVLTSCPGGYSLKNGTCQTCDAFPADFTCPREGESLDESGRTCEKSVPVPSTCPCGYTMVDGECVQKLPSTLECPAGFSLQRDTKECVKRDRCPATMVCPEGAFERDGKCINVRQDSPRCPSGYVFDAESQRCSKSVCEVPGDCPFGFNRIGDRCEHVDKTPADEFCPVDYVMDVSGSCIKEVPIPPRCPAGFQHSRDVDGVCEKIVKEVPNCPAGTISVASKCQRTLESEMTQCCPTGYELELGVCKKVQEHLPTLSCEGGCFKVKTARVAFACPEETEFEDHPTTPKCIKRSVASDCPVPVKFEPSPRCLKKKHHKGSEESELRALQFDFDSECLPPTPEPCQEIKKEEVIIAQPYCPEGGDLEGKHCVIREPIIPEKVCKVGTLDPTTEQCITVVTAPVESKCPPGTRREGMKCTSIEIVQPDFVCPTESETGPNGCCLVRTQSIYSAPNVLRAPTTIRCDVGNLNKNDKTCVQITTAPRDMVCPSGSYRSYDGKCVVTAELIIPAPVEKTVRPSYVCPNGGVLNGKDCNSTQKQPARTVCPSDSYLDVDNKCIKVAETLVHPARVIKSVAVPVCPPGTQSRGTTCIATIETELLKSCPPEFELRDNKCVKSVPQKAVCPAGMIETVEGCARDLYAAPKVRVVKGCVNDVTPTCEGCPKQIATTCSHK